MSGDEGTYSEAQLLIMERNGFPEETYYTFSYSPIPNDDGSPGGIFCANTDDTQRVISERQLSLLRELASSAAESRSVQQACDSSARALMTGRRRPHLVLSDIMMPRLNGFGLLKALRNDSELRDVPVILLSARAGEEAKLEGLDAGADDYLSKPFSARELLARVRANIEMAALRREAVQIENELRHQALMAKERAETILPASMTASSRSTATGSSPMSMRRLSVCCIGRHRT
jgi:CheY-like chemotaxis protein